MWTQIALPKLETKQDDTYHKIFGKELLNKKFQTKTCEDVVNLWNMLLNISK